MKITLTAEDTARLGVGPTLAFDLNKIMAREAIVLQKVVGVTPDELSKSLQGAPVLDEQGRQAYQVDDAGALVLDEEGQPIPLRRINLEALVAFVWMAARRAGCKVPFDEFDFDIIGTQVGDNQVVGAPGKDESTPATT